MYDEEFEFTKRVQHLEWIKKKFDHVFEYNEIVRNVNACVDSCAMLMGGTSEDIFMFLDARMEYYRLHFYINDFIRCVLEGKRFEKSTHAELMQQIANNVTRGRVKVESELKDARRSDLLEWSHQAHSVTVKRCCFVGKENKIPLQGVVAMQDSDARDLVTRSQRIFLSLLKSEKN